MITLLESCLKATPLRRGSVLKKMCDEAMAQDKIAERILCSVKLSNNLGR